MRSNELKELRELDNGQETACVHVHVLICAHAECGGVKSRWTMTCDRMCSFTGYAVHLRRQFHAALHRGSVRPEIQLLYTCVRRVMQPSGRLTAN